MGKNGECTPPIGKLTLRSLSAAPATNDRCTDADKKVLHTILNGVLTDGVSYKNYNEASPGPLDWKNSYNNDVHETDSWHENISNDNSYDEALGNCREDASLRNYLYSTLENTDVNKDINHVNYGDEYLEPSAPGSDDIEENYFSNDQSLEEWEKQINEKVHYDSDYDDEDSWFEDEAEFYSGLDENYVPCVTAKPRKPSALRQYTKVKYKLATKMGKEPEVLSINRIRHYN